MNFYFKITGFFLLLLLSIQSKALGYKDSLCAKYPSSQHQLSLIWFNSGYRVPVNKQNILNSGHGLYVELGINPGTLISKDLVLAIYGGWAFMDKAWNTFFNKDFSKNYKNAMIQQENQSSLDSAVIQSSSLLFDTKTGNSISMPGCEMNSFHNYAMYFGIVIKLPHKNSPILKLYKGSLRSHYQGDGNIVSKNMDFNIFEIRRMMYGGELMVLHTNQMFKKEKNIKTSRKRGHGALSIYYETSDFYNASLYFYDGVNRKTIPFKNFIKQDFLTHYKREVFWGFKLSYYLF